MEGSGDGDMPASAEAASAEAAAAAAASFLVLQQRTAFEVFPSERRLAVVTVLDVLVRDRPGYAPPPGALYRVPLHARQMAILDVLVDGAPAVFEHADCRVEVLPLDPATRRRYAGSPDVAASAAVQAAEEDRRSAPDMDLDDAGGGGGDDDSSHPCEYDGDDAD